MIFLIALATFLSTILGGLFALQLRDRLHLILGFSAGAVIGVAFFDLLPEAVELSSKSFDPATVLSVTVLGFISYLILDRLVLFHGHDHDKNEEEHSKKGILGAGSLSLHSFLDGLGVGLAFQISNSVGVIVAIAVLAHDFSDGINTVGFILKNKGERKNALKWLFIDAIAPVLGIFTTTLFQLKETSLGLLLALFGGFFLYIGAADLIPESYHAHPTKWTTFTTILGVITLYAIIKIAGI
jgi:ZIP family zinc transporter